MIVDNQKVFYRLNSEKFVTRRMGNEMVMVPLSDSVADMTSVLTLNEVGADILKELEEPSTIDQVIERLLNSYEIDESTLRSDVEDFLQNAVERNVVQKIKNK